VQTAGEIQSALPAQVDLHAPKAQMKFPQARLAGVLQTPLPSQVEAGMTVVVPPQAAALQLTPLSTNAQDPPTQFPVVPQVEVAVARHLPCGSGALSATAVQVPTFPIRLQDLHASEHALSQHTPWAQKPD
jgi:hypothetical protein